MIRVAFCCNDERGNHTAKVDAIDFGDSDLRLAGPARSMRLVQFGVRIGRRKYETSGMWVSGTGNIFRDSTGMSLDAAHSLASDLLASGWTVEEHTCDGPFADLLNTGEPPARGEVKP